jgi:hypothetical protein
MDAETHTKRNELFQEVRTAGYPFKLMLCIKKSQLKPCCVKLSQLALKEDGSAGISKELREATSLLLQILNRRCRDNLIFDDKLADYVFFPVSQILRLCQKRPDRLAELATKCLRVLLEFGWGTVAIDLGKQLLLLLTSFAGGGQSSSSISEELHIEAYGALAALFKSLHRTPKGAASLIEVSTIPTLGQCLSVILDGVTDGPSPESQVEALSSLEALWSCVKDPQALSNFLPGTISALTKCLMPSTKAPRTRKVLISALGVFRVVVTTTLNDVATRNLKDDKPGPEVGGKSTPLSKSWLLATASQIKLALANVVKLRNHDHHDVRRALRQLCEVLLDECHTSLAESAAILVETAMTIASSDTEGQDSSGETSLEVLATIHQSISDLIKSTIYNWVTSLPRVMQSNDELSKQIALRQIARARELLSGLEVNSEVLDNALSESMKNSVVSLLELPSASRGFKETSVESISPNILLSDQKSTAKSYSPILMPHDSQIQTRQSLDALIAGVGSPKTQIRMAGQLSDLMRTSSGVDLLSSFWLSFRLLKAATAASSSLDDFIDYSSASSEDQEGVMTELYTYSVSALSEMADEISDWRVQALGLEVVAYAAQSLGEAFRPDLVDTLYPIVHLLGSSNADLREHAIVSLNLISESCGYNSTSEMIVQNVDYLVNAVSLKLNTFDISPQAPQVLVMMIRLTGSSLLPYLDDVVVSIFAALDNFHGYPRLVESLFNVLGEIVEKSDESKSLKLTASSMINHRKGKPTGCTIEDVISLLKKTKNRASATYKNEHEEFPQEPWKSAKTLLDEREGSQEEQEEELGENNDAAEIQKAPPSKVYTMVQSIARLGQNYLTNQSPILRQKLLDLVSTACEVLYRDEDQFLPLVNDIWPVLVKRLYDHEPFVQIAASKAVSEICKCAGDFMSTRIQMEWHDLMKLVRNAKAKAIAEKKGKHGRGIYSQSWQKWEGFINLLVTILEYVRINDDMFDEVLQILADLLVTRADVHTALSVVNADAVWLEELRQGQYSELKVPLLEDYAFASLDAASV